MTLVPGQQVEFDRKKSFKYIRPLGSGGTGDTRLFEDETTEMLFAIKKYSPASGNDIDENYVRFVDEIKILFNLSHPNIVRVYNYYLFPEHKLGYLQMEFIDGKPINEFSLETISWSDYFIDAVNAFKYLETNGVLHRDIRPANILIDSNENLKVIDFGFGKALESDESGGKSVMLNWPVTELPEEISKEGMYTHQSEVYFLGKLFSSLSLDEGTLFSNEPFKYHHIIEKMIQPNPLRRYTSFAEVSTAISQGIIATTYFSVREKNIYQKIADALYNKLNYYTSDFSFVHSVQSVLNNLSELLRVSALETKIQNNSTLIKCFVVAGFNYSSQCDIPTKDVEEFYIMLNSFSEKKQRIVLENIWARLQKISVKLPNDADDEDLPF